MGLSSSKHFKLSIPKKWHRQRSVVASESLDDSANYPYATFTYFISSRALSSLGSINTASDAVGERSFSDSSSESSITLPRHSVPSPGSSDAYFNDNLTIPSPPRVIYPISSTLGFSETYALDWNATEQGKIDYLKNMQQYIPVDMDAAFVDANFLVDLLEHISNQYRSQGQLPIADTCSTEVGCMSGIEIATTQLTIEVINTLYLLAERLSVSYEYRVPEHPGKHHDGVFEKMLIAIKDTGARFLGPTHRTVINTTSMLCVYYYARKQWANAEEQANCIAREVEQSLDWDTTFAYWLSRIYIRQQKWYDVERVLEEIVERSPPGTTTPDWPSHHLVGVYVALEKWEKAWKIVERTDNQSDLIDRQYDGKWRIKILTGQENWGEAKREFVRVYPRLGRRRRSSTSDARYMIAVIYLGQQRWDRAESKFSRSIDWMRWRNSTRKSRWTRGDRENLKNVCGLAKAAMGAGNEEAEGLLKQVVEGCQQGIGLDSRVTLDAMDTLASFRIKEKRWDEAESLLSQVVERRKGLNAQGPSHPATLRSMESLATTYIGMSRWQDAAEALEHIVAERDKWPGPDHPQTFLAIDTLSQVYRKLERWVEMDKMMRRMLRAR